MQISINELMAESGVQFGTSGVRGLVKDMTGKVCFSYVTAFLQYLKTQKQISVGTKIGIAGDLRSSTPAIMNAATVACLNMGLEPINYGFIPAPAVALFGIHKKIPTIMVTGSHIPDDRNGIKFNTPLGEILKSDEQEIRAQQIDILEELFTAQGQLRRLDYLPTICGDAENHYIKRFIDFFSANCLQEKQIGLYEHSSVSRDCIKVILQGLGANVTSLARSEQFISVDTEAIRPEDVLLAKQWAQDNKFDCIISTDGDGDRPLISDEKGNWLRGDVAGVLCAQYLDADIVVTPVSSNSSVDKSELFDEVRRTKIGSPYVIEAMQYLSERNPEYQVVGYEANGGFLQQTSITLKEKQLSALPTRDAVIVPLAILLLAQQQTISELVKTLPQRYTYSDRLKDFPTEISQQKLVAIRTDLQVVKQIFGFAGTPISIDNTDGVRITFDNEDIIHLRPSGNAPELRCYTEAITEGAAAALNQRTMAILSQWKNKV